jgi:hypothetical protein
MPIKRHPTDPDKVVFVSHKPILNYDEQAARIKVLEKALIASEQDYETLLQDRIDKHDYRKNGWIGIGFAVGLMVGVLIGMALK